MSDGFDSGPGDGGDAPGDDVVVPVDDAAGDGDGGPGADVVRFASDDEGDAASLGGEEADEDDVLLGVADGQVVDDVGTVVGEALVEPWAATTQSDELGDRDLTWWTATVSVAGELLQAWPAAPSPDVGALSEPWTSSFDLEPVSGFADPALLGSAEPPPSGRAKG